MESKELQHIEMSDEITLSDIIQILKRRKWLLISTFAITVALTLIYLFFIATPTYEITATIKIPKSSSGMSLSGAAALVLGGSTTSPAVDEQIEIMKSRKVLGNVVKELNLLDYFKSKAKNPEKVELTENQVINMLYKDIVNATSKKNTSLISLTVALDDKELAYKIAQSVIKNYIEVAKELNKDENSYLYDFVKQQLPIAEKELIEIETKIRDFQKTKSISPSAEIDYLVKSYNEINGRITQSTLDIQTIDVQIQLLNARISEVKGMAKKEDYQVNSAKLSMLRNKLIELEVQKNSLLLKYTEESEPVKEINTQIATIKGMIEEEISKILSTKIETQDPILSELHSSLSRLMTQKEALNASLKGLQKVKEELDDKLKKLPDIQREYVTLQREYGIKQQIYTALKAKEEELRLSTAGMNFNVPVVIDEPYIPEKPAKPNKKLTLAIGGVLGIFLGILAAFLREASDSRILDENQLTTLTGQMPVIFDLPIESEKNTDAFKNTLVHIYGESNENTNKIVHITSAGNVDEKHKIALEIGKLSSALGKRTLVIDLEGHITKLIGNENIPNISSFIADKELKIYKENLSIISKNEEDSPYITLNEKIKEKLNALKEKIDTVIIITKHVASAESRYISSMSDKNLLITKKGISTKAEVLSGLLQKNPQCVFVKK